MDIERALKGDLSKELDKKFAQARGPQKDTNKSNDSTESKKPADSEKTENKEGKNDKKNQESGK